MARELQLRLDDNSLVGTVDLDPLFPEPDAGASTLPTIDVSNHGFAGDGSGGCLGEFIAERAHEECAFLLPDGRYRWTRPLRFTGGGGEFDLEIPDRVALIGQPEATIHVDIDSDEPKHRSLFWFGARNKPVPEVILHDLHVDVGDANPDRDAGICRASVEAMDAKNISMTRRCRLNPDGSRNGDRFSYKVDVLDEGGVATHRNIDLTAGDTHRPDAGDVGHAIPFASEPHHVGVNRWLGCRVAGYTDNGFYVRNYSETGRNILEGCLARNCGGGNIRVGRNDQVRACRIVIDGTEEPANGCGLWVENAKATSVDGVTIDAPELANDLIRVTGAISSGSIRNVDAHQGGQQYAIKATAGNCEQFTFDSITVYDRGDGEIRTASIYCTMDHATFRDVAILNRDHHGRGGTGRPGLCVAAEDVAFRDCRFETDAAITVRLGSPFVRGADVGVRFDGCTFQNTDPYEALMTYENHPKSHQLTVKNGTISGYDQLINNGSIYGFDTVSFRDNFGYSDWTQPANQK